MQYLIESSRANSTAGESSQHTRCAFTITELVVAATLLVTAMSVVVPLAVRTGRLWQDSRHNRLAMEELSNQLDWLTSLDATERTVAIDEIGPSRQISSALPNPELSVETLTDENGTRLILSLAWDHIGPRAPISLVGWIDPLPSATDQIDGGSAE